MSDIASDVENGIALIRLMRPGDGVLGPDVRASLMRALENAARQGDIDAVVLSGTGATFSTGLDLREYDREVATPTVRDLTHAIETNPKPVVAALNGAALEVGFEIALAAHARVARAGTKVALPQVALGMVPSGGATQRLPRLVGAQTALDLLLGGRGFAVEDDRLVSLFDQITTEVPLRAAQLLARRLADQGRWTRACDTMTGLADPMAYQAAIRAASGKIKDTASVEADIIRAVEAALLLPFAQGLDLEETAAQERQFSTVSRARRHLFGADRLAASQVSKLGSKTRQVRTVAIIGDDRRLVALATSSLDRCEEVILFGKDIGTSERTANAVDAVLAGLVDRGALTAAARDTMVDRLSLSDDPEILKSVDLVLDGGGPWGETGGIMHGAVWCVLDDTADAVEQARKTGAETLVIGPYRPAHPASLAEIVLTAETSSEAAGTAARFFTGMGRTVLCQTATQGLLGEQISAPLYMAALTLARHGVEPPALEEAMRELGFPRGVLEMVEREGARRVLSQLSRHFPDLPGADWLVDRMTFMERNWPGAGALYSAGPERATLDPDLPAWLASWRESAGIAEGIPDVPVSQAIHAALINRVATLQREEHVTQPELVDLCLVRGFGQSRDRGGLLFQADTEGLLPHLRAMKALAPISPLWAPDPRIEEMVNNGVTFFGRVGGVNR